MGRLLLISRLVRRDIRRRPVQAALLLLVITTTSTTLTLGLALRRVAQSPFARTRAATKGPDIVARVQPRPGTPGTPRRAAALLRHASGVAAVAPPLPLAFTRLTSPGVSIPVNVEGRTSKPTAINQPLLTDGHWVRADGAVIEEGLAGALGLRVGDWIHLRGHRFRVAGIALQTEQAFYPACTPGLVWVTPGDAERLATASDPLGYELDVKLTHPSATDAFYNSAAFNDLANALVGNSIGQSWQAIKREDYRAVTNDQKALLIGSWLLGLLAIASIATLVGGRMTEQTRRVGLLKAVGATPRMVGGILLAENLLLAIAGAGAGLLVGWLLVPSFSSPGRGLLGTPPSPNLTLVSIAEVILASTVVAMVSTFIPAARGARTSTVRALNDPARPPKRHPRLIAISAHLPPALLLGLRLMARRLRRTVLTSAGLAVAVAMIVAALTLQQQADAKVQASLQTGLFLDSSIGGRVTHRGLDPRRGPGDAGWPERDLHHGPRSWMPSVRPHSRGRSARLRARSARP